MFRAAGAVLGDELEIQDRHDAEFDALAERFREQDAKKVEQRRGPERWDPHDEDTIIRQVAQHLRKIRELHGLPLGGSLSPPPLVRQRDRRSLSPVGGQPLKSVDVVSGAAPNHTAVGEARLAVARKVLESRGVMEGIPSNETHARLRASLEPDDSSSEKGRESRQWAVGNRSGYFKPEGLVRSVGDGVGMQCDGAAEEAAAGEVGANVQAIEGAAITSGETASRCLLQRKGDSEESTLSNWCRRPSRPLPALLWRVSDMLVLAVTWRPQ